MSKMPYRCIKRAQTLKDCALNIQIYTCMDK